MPRALAYLIDLGIFVLVVMGVWFGMAALGMGGTVEGLGSGAYALFIFLANWGYNVIFEAGPRGATPGKRVMQLRVVADTGGPPGWSAVMLRNVTRVADMLPACYFTGLLVCLFTSRFQRLGDLVASTLVVYDRRQPVVSSRHALRLQGAMEPPPVALTRDERAAVVRFMERGGLWPQARAQEVADHASPLTGARGPEGLQRLVRMATWLRDS